MKSKHFLRVTALFLAAAAAFPQTAPASGQSNVPEKTKESQPRQGPDGLEGWTLSGSIPDHSNETFPFTLVIARNGRVLRKIDGDPFIWQWIFWDNGREVAYESGPLHFALQCNLASVATGKRLASFDCFHGIPVNAPGWLKALEKAP